MSSRKVALFIDMEGGYGRDVLRGVNRYTRTRMPWIMFGDPERIVAPIRNLSNWRGDGMIVQVSSSEGFRFLENASVPIVNVSQLMRQSDYPRVVSDSRRIGQLGALHLLERGFRHLAFCGFTDHHYSELREEAFAAEAVREGLECSRLDTEPPQVRPEQWGRGQKELARWLLRLPKPVGVMACNDVRARHVSKVCFEAGIRIPEMLALVGADDDALVCETSNPPLSSVDVSAEIIGYQAAMLLDRLMNGEKIPSGETILVPPKGVVVRRSSEMFAIPDPGVAKAVRFIHDHAAEPIGVEDVVGAVPLSRRVLERRFRAVLDRTVYEMIAHARIERAKQLLLHSDIPTTAIAERSGFAYVQQFNSMFKRLVGLTPGAFRAQFRSDLRGN